MIKLREKRQYTQEEIETGLAILLDPVGFGLFFWPDDTTVPETRRDLPEHWRGKQVISCEQVLMATAVSMHMLFGDAADEMLPDASRRAIVRTARKIGKTTWVVERGYIQAAFTYTGDGQGEFLLHTPGDAHMAPLVSRIDRRVDRTPIFKIMHSNRKMDSGIDSWHNGAVFYRRIEGAPASGGRNMIGLRVRGVIGDEGDYSSRQARDEMQQSCLPSAWEVWCGVPRPKARGIMKAVARGKDAGWLRLMQGNWKLPMRWDMRANPIYHSQRAFSEQLGKDAWDSSRVITQVLGMEDDEGVSAFPFIPTVEAPWFRHIAATGEDLAQNMDSILSALAFDAVPEQASQWTIHADYGHSPSPMVVGVSFFHDDWNSWVLFARIVVTRAETVIAARFINALDINMPVRPSVLVFDAHGRGAGVFETLRNADEYSSYRYNERLVAADFHASFIDERTLVHRTCKTVLTVGDSEDEWDGQMYCSRCRVVVYGDEAEPRRIRGKQYLTGLLNDCLERGRAFLAGNETTSGVGILLPVQDQELIFELSGTTTFYNSDTGYVSYSPPLGPQEDHNTDMLRALARAVLAMQSAEVAAHRAARVNEWGFFSIEP